MWVRYGHKYNSYQCRYNNQAMINMDGSVTWLEALQYKHVKDLSIEIVCEALAVEIPTLKVIVLSVFRPYVNNNHFLSYLCIILNVVSKDSLDIVLSTNINSKWRFLGDLMNLL